MATQEVEVTVPDGIFAGDEFLLEFDGQQLSVVCPDGCQGGDAINLQIPVNDAPAEGAADGAPNQVQVVVPEGCYPGDEFTVEFDGQSFNIGVPDGCGPGSELMVDVPQAEAAAPEPASTSSSSRANINPREMKIPPYRGKDGKVKSSEWHGSSSLFSMGPAEGFGNPAGIYHVGQLVQVTRSDGSWTYGKIMEYDDLGDNYSIMTRAGPKHMVDPDSITDDIVVNPSDGSCAQQ